MAVMTMEDTRVKTAGVAAAVKAAFDPAPEPMTPAERRRLAGELAKSKASHAARLADAEKVSTEADAAVRQHEYQQLVDRAKAARAELESLRFQDIASHRIEGLLRVAPVEAIELLRADADAEFSDWRNTAITPRNQAAANQRVTILTAVLRQCSDVLPFEVDPERAAADLRRKHSIRARPRAGD